MILYYRREIQIKDNGYCHWEGILKIEYFLLTFLYR